MILYKSWLETRQRFLFLTVALAALCICFVLIHPSIIAAWKQDKIDHPEWPDPPWLATAMSDYVFFIWHFLYDYLFQVAWILAVCLLAGGGFLSDSANGSLIYTLSLPVRRTSWMYARLTILLAESAALAFIPVVVVPALSPVIGQNYPVLDAASHSFVMFAAGIVFVAASIVIASIIDGEYAGLLLTAFTLLVPQILMRSYAGRNPHSWIARSGFAMAMSATPHVRSWMDVSWIAIMTSIAIASVLILLGTRIVAESEIIAG